MTTFVYNLLTPLPGGTNCEANAITPDGARIVGWSSGSGFTSHACYWDRSGGGYGAPVDIGVLVGDVSSIAFGVSSDNMTVVGRSTGPVPVLPAVTPSRGFMWTAGGGMIALASHDGLTRNDDATAACCSSDGAIIGGEAVSAPSTQPQACYWTSLGTVITTLPALGGPATADIESGVSACSLDGSFFAGSLTSDLGGNTYAILWTGIGYAATDLGDIGGGTYAIANGISGAGDKVVGNAIDSGSGSHAFVWTSGAGMVDVGAPVSDTNAIAQSISSDGSTIGGIGSAEFEGIWVWNETDGFILVQSIAAGNVEGLSGNGSVPVGFVQDNNGHILAVWWGPSVPPPTPAVLNMDNVVVTSLATESPCTVALFTTPPPFNGPAFGLRWSDTRGLTWGNAVPRPLSTDPMSQPRWNRTGYARDRVFELFWSAALRTALNGAFVETVPWKS